MITKVGIGNRLVQDDLQVPDEAISLLEVILEGVLEINLFIKQGSSDSVTFYCREKDYRLVTQLTWEVVILANSVVHREDLNEIWDLILGIHEAKNIEVCGEVFEVPT